MIRLEIHAKEYRKKLWMLFLQNKHYIVPGKGNAKFAFLPRILSRAKVLKFTGDAFKKHTAS